MHAKYKEITVSINNNALTITLNRPERLNTLTINLRKEIMDVLKRHKDDDIACVIFDSAGDVFSAGADIRYLLSLKGKDVNKYAKFVLSFLKYIENYPKITIGLVKGIAVGGGLELLLALDIVIASPEAKFGQTEVKLGLIPGGGGTQRLTKIVGVRKAKELIFTGRLISAEEALRIGLINQVADKSKLFEEAMNYCALLDSMSKLALRLAKKAVNASLQKPLNEGLIFENMLYQIALWSNESRKRMSAFLAKS